MVWPSILTEPWVVESLGKTGSDFVSSFAASFGGVALAASCAGAHLNAKISRSVQKPKRLDLRREFTEGWFLAQKSYRQYFKSSPDPFMSTFPGLRSGRDQRFKLATEDE